MKVLEIEWKHLDKSGSTCSRCFDTGIALQEVIEGLVEECKDRGWRVMFKETMLSASEISESNLILFNGRPIEDVLPRARVSESHCTSCGDLTGDPSISCRAVGVGDDIYEGIPASVIRQAACEVAQCCR